MVAPVVPPLPPPVPNTSWVIPADVCHQVYLQKNSTSGTPDACARYCATAKAAGLDAIVWHGGPRWLLAKWDGLAKIAADHGLLAGAGFGLDGTLDADGTELTPAEKGELMGRVLGRASCVFALADAEGRWDGAKKVLAHMDEAGALDLGRALLAALHAAGADGKPVGDQLWFAIESHGDPRAPARPLGRGGPFRGFPADEFAYFAVNWIRFRQLYCNNENDKNRCRRDRAWMDRDWTRFDADLVKSGNANLRRELGVTLQSYKWDDIPWDLADLLLEHVVAKSQPVIAWGEPAMSAGFLAITRAVHFLRDTTDDATGLPFAHRALSPRDMVAGYQRAYNLRAPESRKLDADGALGWKTAATMGIAP